MKMCKSSKSAVERKASLLSCDSSRPQNRRVGKNQTRRSLRVRKTKARMAWARVLRRKQGANLKRGGLRHHETQKTCSSHAPSENRHTNNRQNRLEAPRRTIGGIYRVCPRSQQGR